jgi:hypothetical protein
LSAADTLSGIKETKYRIDDGGWEVYSSSFTVTGSSTAYYYSEDEAGNTEAEKSTQIRIDKTPPPAPVIFSSTHTEDIWSTSDAPSFSWTEPYDTSGIAGYSCEFDNSLDTIPDTASEGTDTSKSYSDVAGGAWYFHVRAKDGAGNWGITDHYGPVKINNPPEITSKPITTATQDVLYTYDVGATDSDAGDVLTYSLTASPTGMTIDENTGSIQWTPTEEQVGDNDVEVKAADSTEATDTQSFTITVEPPELTVKVYCLVDLVIIDPKGRAINKVKIEEEYLSEGIIPPPVYKDKERDLDGDGELDDEVVIPNALVGNYIIEVVPEEEGQTDTYTLDVIQVNEEPRRLADGLPVQAESHDFFFSQCDMEQGWNLISVPVRLVNNSPDAALKSIDGHYSSVWAYERTDDATDGQWRRCIADAPPWLSDLETIEAGKGYWIRMTDSTPLILDGDQVADEPVPLKQGWNLVGYNYLTEQSLEKALPSEDYSYNSVWTYDARDRQWKRCIVGAESLSNLKAMEPGKGYWVDAKVSHTWNVSESIASAPASPPAAAESRWSHSFASSEDVVPTDRPEIPCLIWGSVEDNGVKMTRRSNCTVLLKVDDEVQSSYRLGAVGRYGDFYVLDMDIPEATSSVQAELYVQVDDTITKAASMSPGRPGHAMRFDLQVHLVPKASLLYQNYPNPCNPDTWIPYRLREDADVVIGIYTATGQLIRTLNLGRKPAGFYTDRERAAHWDGKNEASERVASGVYFYSIEAGDLTAIRKMTIMR